MNLVSERNSWKKEFEETGKCDNHFLKLYKENRDSELWRISRSVEHLCEYVLYLEELKKEVETWI